MKRLTLTASLLAVVVLGTGCLEWWPELGLPADDKNTWMEWNPIQDMIDDAAIRDQQALRYPAAATVATNERPYPFQANEALKSAAVHNPVPITQESLQYGKQAYDTACVVCHGAKGKGAGSVVPPFPQPPDLTANRVQAWTDGEIYHVITHGQGRMWSYKSQLKPMERWAVVNYVRALQRAEYPEPRDLERVKDE